MARYRRFDPRFWKDEKVRTLSLSEKTIAAYCFTAQSNRIGLFSFSPWEACEDLDMPQKTFSQGFENVCRTLAWCYDSKARILYIPSWWKYNRPENTNNVIGNLKDLDDVPESPLIADFLANTKYLLGELKQAFVHTLRQRYPEGYPQRSPSQEQYQEQEQEQKVKTSPPADAGAIADSSLNGWGTPEALIALYNADTPTEFASVTTLSPGRRSKAKKYLSAFPQRDFWVQVFAECKVSLFLRGLTVGKDGRKFHGSTLDWLLTKGKDGTENCVKVAEGNYGDK